MTPEQIVQLATLVVASPLLILLATAIVGDVVATRRAIRDQAAADRAERRS